MLLLNYTPSDVVRFWQKVDKSGECWLFTGAKLIGGYGHFKLHGTYPSAHRFSYTLFYGAIPPGLHVLHQCDNPPCVRPQHLFLGTDLDNQQDSRRKGRARPLSAATPRLYGENHPQAKLTFANVRAMRALAASQPIRIDKIAEKYGVSPSAISQVIHNKTWLKT